MLHATTAFTALLMLGSVTHQVTAARSRSTRCHYRIIINEMDLSQCPYLDQRPESQDPPTRLAFSNPQRDGLTPPQEQMVPPEVNVINNTKDHNSLESRLLQEAVRNRELKVDLLHQSQQVSGLEQKLDYHLSNASVMEAKLRDAEEALVKQSLRLQSIEEKLTILMLDMVEVKHRFELEDYNRSCEAEKVIPVQSMPGLSGCSLPEGAIYYQDCEEVYQHGYKKSGIYHVKSIYNACPIPVLCDMDTPPGGWLVIQRRHGGETDFNQNWQGYKQGFGDMNDDFWLGNDNVFLISNQRHYQLRVDLWDFYESRVYAEYRHFKIGGERDMYQLHVSNGTGTAYDSLETHSGMFFSTPDRDNDAYPNYHCAKEWESGWWFTNCWYAFLNGKNYNTSNVRHRGLAWNSWKTEQLKWAEMKIRPSP